MCDSGVAGLPCLLSQQHFQALGMCEPLVYLSANWFRRSLFCVVVGVALPVPLLSFSRATCALDESHALLALLAPAHPNYQYPQLCSSVLLLLWYLKKQKAQAL
jgi:hypothetical protein